MSNIRSLMGLSPVIPVIVLERVSDAVPLARALVAGGIRVLEITLRTPVALDCIRAIRAEVPDAICGVGTIINAADVDASIAAGAQFGVSPGTTPSVLAQAQSKGLPLLPGVMNPSDIMLALEAGYSELKLFPAKQAGGVDTLKAFGGPFPQVTFCPTGGIDINSAPSFLALPNVACVGGSWLTPKALVDQQDWAAIEALARTAAQLKVGQ